MALLHLQDGSLARGGLSPGGGPASPAVEVEAVTASSAQLPPTVDAAMLGQPQVG